MADSPAPVEGLDDTQYLKGWTAQQGTAPFEPPRVPGNVVLESELPDPKLLEKGGIDTATYFGAVVVAKDAAEKAALLREHVEAPAEEAPVEEAPVEEAPVSDAEPTGDPAQA